MHSPGHPPVPDPARGISRSARAAEHGAAAVPGGLLTSRPGVPHVLGRGSSRVAGVLSAVSAGRSGRRASHRPNVLSARPIVRGGGSSVLGTAPARPASGVRRLARRAARWVLRWVVRQVVRVVLVLVVVWSVWSWGLPAARDAVREAVADSVSREVDRVVPDGPAPADVERVARGWAERVADAARSAREAAGSDGDR